MERHAAHTPSTRRASACAAGARALRERHHNFRHFSSLLSALYFGGLGILGTFNLRAPL